MESQRWVPLNEFMASNWGAFSTFEQDFGRRFNSFSRSLPTRFYSSLRKGVSSAFGGLADGAAGAGAELPRFKFKVVLDTNIVVQDAIAVAKGKPSTTERILASEFVEVYAPREIEEEVERILRARSGKRFPLEPALSHASRLLRRVRLVEANYPSIRRSREAIGERAPEDVPFLAVAIELGVDAVVSRDKIAFDQQPVVRRWELGKMVESVVTFESGSVSAVVIGTSVKTLFAALQKVVVALVGVFLDIIAVAVEALAKLVSGVLSALSRVPAWGWLIVLGVTIAAGVYVATHPGAQERLAEGIATLVGGAQAVARAIVDFGTAIISGVHDLLVWLWNAFLPLTGAIVVIAGVLINRVRAMLDQAVQLQRSVPVGQPV